MDTSDLQDDLDKLSKLLDEPDPEDLKEYDDHSLGSQCKSSGQFDKHHSLIPTSSLRYACESSTSDASNRQQEKQDCDRLLNKRTPSIEPGDKQTSIITIPSDLSSSDEDQNCEYRIQLSDDSMDLEENCGSSSHISPTACVDLAEPPEKTLTPPPALDNHALEIPSQTQPTRMPPPPAPDDILHGFDGFIQESCAPDFDLPDAVVDTASSAADEVEVPVPQGDVQYVGGGVQDWQGDERSAALSSDIGRLSQILDAPDAGRDADRGEDLVSHWGEEDADPSAGSDTTESSAVQGDINKLSQVLATASVAPPMHLDPFSRPTPVPSSGRGRGSGSGHASVASTSGAQLPSALGDELLSQDDFLDDTFIGQDVPVNLENCLALNTAYQEVVDENLADLEQLLRHNRARQAELTTLMSTTPDSGRPQPAKQVHCSKWNWRMFMSQYFTDAKGFGPPPNEDTRTKTALGEYEDLRWSPTWLQSEREKLFEAMLAEARSRHERATQHRVVSLRNALRQMETKMTPEQRDTAEAKASLTGTRSQLEEAERLLAEAKQESVLDIIAHLDDQYDWEAIAQTSMGGQRSATECRLQWCNFVRPTISHAEWTPEEDKRVRDAAASRSDNRWQTAADELGRTAFQVFQRWKAVLAIPKRAFWSDMETEQLVRAVRSVRIGNYINWALVAVRLPGRSVIQCSQRYSQLTAKRRRGRFTVQEDIRLIAAVEVAGIKDYHAIAAYIPTRASWQLSRRYMGHLSLNMHRHQWTREEDKQLVSFVSEHGPLWSQAAVELGTGRNGIQCCNRFRKIEAAFQSRGGVPATGSLAGKTRQHRLEYHSNLRARLNKRLARLTPDGEKDPAEARKQAAMAFLKRKVLIPGVSRSMLRVRNAIGRNSKQRERRETQWSSSSSLLLAEGRFPLKRMGAPENDAAAAAFTARVWCLPRQAPARLETCASAGPPNNEFTANALSAWRAALRPDAPESSLRLAVSAVGGREYNWRRMPLLPASVASCNVFRSLILQRQRLEHHATEYGGPAGTRKRKMKAFNLDVASWAGEAMSGGNDGGAESSTPWLVPTDRTRHQDRVVRVRVTEKPEGDKPPRQFHLTVAAAEAEDPQQLAMRLIRQVPNMVKMDITKAPVVREGTRPTPPPGPPPAASAVDAWHLLTARFVSMLFWPALLSLQPPPDLSDLTRRDQDDSELMGNAFGGMLVVNSDDEYEGPNRTRRKKKKRGPVPSQRGKRAGPQPKRRKQ